ncbi:hypothetical protein [Cryobacterium soli]|uniref:hypothetical protein n=1 Tax=Cryobacterium soli TaxID=2220095 RepID=UPI000E73DB44|nr:hypothetical protein [Cryobacterium soli]
MTIVTARALWEELVDAGLIQPRTYDKELVAGLAESLGLDPMQEFIDELTKSALTPRDLVRELLQALTPISEMLEDLLQLYSEIEAKQADDESLLIQYEFDEGHPVDVLLSNFRRDVTELTGVVRQVTRLDVSQESLWEFPYRTDSWKVSDEPQLERWRRSYVDDSVYGDFPRQSPTGNLALDNAIRKAESIISAVLKATRRYGETREEFGRGHPGEFGVNGSERGILSVLHSDKWVSSSVLGMDSVIKERSLSEQEIADALADWADQFPLAAATETVLMSAVESLLSLPMWGKRHALYSAWLLTQIDLAVDGKLTYVVVNGKLSFPFGGSQLATLDTVDGPLELWTEMRSSLVKPKGTGRTNAIQPDYRFVADVNDRVNTTHLAIEAKQYAKSTKAVHAHALDDYTRGLPNAMVILAAYGPVSRNVLDSIPQGQSDRAIVIRHLRPAAVDAREEFARQVNKALPDLKARRLTYPLDVTLTWASHVHDVDLHAFAPKTGVHVWWENQAHVDVRLNGHTYDGNPQVLEVTSVPEHTLAIWVSVYDSDPISEARPVITINTSEGPLEIRPTAPPSGVRTWHALNLLPNGELEIIDAHPPFPR